LLNCDWVLVVVTAHTAQSDWVRAEIRTALTDPRFDRRVLPLKVDDAEPSQITHELGLIEALDVRQDPDIGQRLYQFLTTQEIMLRMDKRPG